MSKHPDGEEIDKDDLSLPKEIQHLVKEERVHRIVHYHKIERLLSAYGSYEELSNWFQLLWIVLCKVSF